MESKVLSYREVVDVANRLARQKDRNERIVRNLSDRMKNGDDIIVRKHESATQESIRFFVWDNESGTCSAAGTIFLR